MAASKTSIGRNHPEQLMVGDIGMSDKRKTENGAAVELAAKGFFYSPVPMLLINRDGIVIEVNCALRELMKTELVACKGHHYDHLEQQINHSLQGSIIPSGGIIAQQFLNQIEQPNRIGMDNLEIAEEFCNYTSPVFGHAKLRSRETPLIGTSTGDVEGAILSVEVLEIERLRYYQDELQKRFTHELMWEVYAASYDRILLEMPFYQEVLHRHVTTMNSPSINNILDLGAGTGNVAVRLLQEGKSVTAVDLSIAMLRKLFSKLYEPLAEKLVTIEETAERLPQLNGNCFDGVNVLLAFFDMQDPFSALGEATRLLKSGGTLIVTEPKRCFNVSELMDFAERHIRKRGLIDELQEDWNRIQSVAPHINQKIQEVQSNTAAEIPKTPWHAEALYEFLEVNGFRNLTFEDSHLGNCATITGTKS
jgi:ubiquinone/menaquinone biosynthesis C-methylase UbiE